MKIFLGLSLFFLSSCTAIDAQQNELMVPFFVQAAWVDGSVNKDLVIKVINEDEPALCLRKEVFDEKGNSSIGLEFRNHQGSRLTLKTVGYLPSSNGEITRLERGEVREVRVRPSDYVQEIDLSKVAEVRVSFAYSDCNNKENKRFLSTWIAV